MNRNEDSECIRKLYRNSHTSILQPHCSTCCQIKGSSNLNIILCALYCIFVCSVLYYCVLCVVFAARN